MSDWVTMPTSCPRSSTTGRRRIGCWLTLKFAMPKVERSLTVTSGEDITSPAVMELMEASPLLDRASTPTMSRSLTMPTGRPSWQTSKQESLRSAMVFARSSSGLSRLARATSLLMIDWTRQALPLSISLFGEASSSSACLMTDRRFAISTASKRGRVRTPTAPAEKASTCCSSPATAVIIRMGISASSGMALRLRQRTIPSIPGMTISIKMASGCMVRAMARARVPDSASRISSPASLNTIARWSRFSRRSSTIKIVGFKTDRSSRSRAAAVPRIRLGPTPKLFRSIDAPRHELSRSLPAPPVRGNLPV